MATVRINIDGREIEAEETLNLIEAARLLGIHIPHFCYHPGLGVDGNCRMCLVELEGVPKPAIACNTTVKELVTKDGVRKVFTANEKVKQLQQSVLEFLFLNHPLDCPICDQSGECLLQDYYMSNGQYQSRLDTPKVHKRKVVPVGERVMLDAERCVLCTRCIRFCDSVTGTGELYIVNRGNRSEITTYPDLPLNNEYSLNTVDICPVGALTSAEFRFKKRVWYLSTVQSVCPGCARGCNTFLEHADGNVYRYRPRENMEVNRYWMCDPGRLSYGSLNEGRLEAANAGPGSGDPEARELPFFQALAEAASWITHARGGNGAGATGGAVVFLVSPASSTETLYAIKRFAADLLPHASVVGAGTRPAGVEDAILRKSDCYPNTAGLRLLGLAGDPVPALSRGGELLVVIEDDPLSKDQRSDWGRYISGFGHVLYLGTHANTTSAAANLSLPIAAHSECDGTFINFQNRLQRFRKAMVPRGDALWAPELLRRLASAAGLTFGWVNLNQLWSDLSRTEEAFRGIDVTRLGAGGVVVSAAAPGPESAAATGPGSSSAPAPAHAEGDEPPTEKGAIP